VAESLRLFISEVDKKVNKKEQDYLTYEDPAFQQQMLNRMLNGPCWNYVSDSLNTVLL
jgi:hypothetical protein